MRHSHTYPVPTRGVSTLAPRNQPDGMMLEQTNMRSDPVNKLSRRPSVTTGTELDNTLWKVYDEYTRGEDKVEVGVDGNSDPVVRVNGIDVSLDTSAYTKGTYITGATEDNLRTHTINDTTFILNTDAVVGREQFIQPKVFEKVWPLINVISALNYGEVVRVELSWDNAAGEDGNVYSKSSSSIVTEDFIEFTIPNAVGGDYTAADLARATYEVAETIASWLRGKQLYIWTTGGIYTGSSGAPLNTTKTRGSTVAVYPKQLKNLHVSLAAGQGSKSIIVFNEVIQSATGLPKYAIPDTLLEVQPGLDSGSSKKSFYLKAKSVDNSESTEQMREVVWQEAVTQYETTKLSGNTMPISILLEKSAVGNYSAIVRNSDDLWTERGAGDDDSNPFPAFVGQNITAMETFQGRLVLSGENEVVMSNVDDIYLYFRESVVQLLATDVASLGSSSTYANTISHMAIHDSNLIVNYRRAQLKVSGNVPVTPQTGTLSPSTTFDTTSVPKPLVFETSLLLPFSYGEAGGVWDYTQREQNDQNTATPITRMVEGYLGGDIQKWAASTSLGMVVLKCEEENALYIYEQVTVGSERTQMAWSKWEIENLGDVLWIGFDNNILQIVTRLGTGTYKRTIDLGYKDEEDKIYLDELLEVYVPEGDTVVTLPTDYPIQANLTCVQTADCAFPFTESLCTRNGTTLTVPSDIHTGSGGSTLKLGSPYKSSFTLPQQFIREEGIVNNVDRLRVKKFTLDVVDTHEASMDVLSKYNETVTVQESADTIGEMLLGVQTFQTGDFVFSYRQDASHANAQFYTNGFLPFNVISIIWEGLYKKRMRSL